MSTGYDPDHLGVHIDLPGFSDPLRRFLARTATANPDYYAHHPNYSVAVNERGSIRAPVVAALNVHQGLIRKRAVSSADGSKAWASDPGLFGEPAITNPYYADRPNVFDRGHMAMRKNAAWATGRGAVSVRDRAIQASRETYYWSNAALQHRHLNQDEWQDLELWVQQHAKARNGKLSTFTGPVFSGYGRAKHATGEPTWEPVEIPAGFFKVIALIDDVTAALRVFAFVLYQDARGATLTAGRAAGRVYDAATVYNDMPYQSTVTEIERATGLVFADVLRQTNPLMLDGAIGPRPGEPETFEVFDAESIVMRADEARPRIRDHQSAVYLAAALVDPAGRDQGREWVSLINLGASPETVHGWKLIDRQGGEVVIDHAAPLAAQESLVVPMDGSLRLNNTGDFLRLVDGDGGRIDWVLYDASEVAPGEPVLFLAPRGSLAD